MAKKELFSTSLQKKSEIAKGLSHPARLAILEFLGQQSACVPTELVELLALNRGTVKQHLDELKKLQWIKSAIREDRLVWCLNLSQIKRDIESLTSFVKSCEEDARKCSDCC